MLTVTQCTDYKSMRAHTHTYMAHCYVMHSLYQHTDTHAQTQKHIRLPGTQFRAYTSTHTNNTNTAYCDRSFKKKLSTAAKHFSGKNVLKAAVVWRQRCIELTFWKISVPSPPFFSLKLIKGSSERNNFSLRHFFMYFTVSQRRFFENPILESVCLKKKKKH